MARVSLNLLEFVSMITLLHELCFPQSLWKFVCFAELGMGKVHYVKFSARNLSPLSTLDKTNDALSNVP